MTADEYIAAAFSALATNGGIASFEIVEQWVTPDRGYLRVRATMANSDFVELAEYFVLVEGEPVTERYRYQWMDQNRQQLRRRWDNVEHYPDLPGYPHHIHLADGTVKPGMRLSLVAVLDAIVIAASQNQRAAAEWEAGEIEADADIAAGRVQTFDDVEALINALHKARGEGNVGAHDDVLNKP